MTPRLHTLVTLTLAAFMSVLTACQREAPGPEVWRFAIEESRGSVQDAYAQRFAELVEQETGGQVRVIVYPYGALGTSTQVTEQTYNGTLSLAMSSPGHLGTLIPEVQAFLLHYVLSPDPEVNVRALNDQALRAFLDELYREKGLAFLTVFGEGEMVWTTQEPVHRPEDLEGVRFRVMTSPFLLASYEAYGASPTPLPYGEVYSGLQLHMIDAQVNPVFAIEEMSFYEVTRCFVYPHHNEFVTTLAANPDWLDGLSPQRRVMLDGILETLTTEIYEVQRLENLARLTEIRERKPDLQEIDLSADEQARFAERAATVRQSFIDQVGPRGLGLLTRIENAVRRAESAP